MASVGLAVRSVCDRISRHLGVTDRAAPTMVFQAAGKGNRRHPPVVLSQWRYPRQLCLATLRARISCYILQDQSEYRPTGKVYPR